MSENIIMFIYSALFYTRTSLVGRSVFTILNARPFIHPFVENAWSKTISYQWGWNDDILLKILFVKEYLVYILLVS